MKRTFTICLLLLASNLFGQDFTLLDNWLKDNAGKMGGRAMLVIWKDGKLIYSKAENEMTRRQKMAGRFMARRGGQTVNFDDFSLTSKQKIASCSKWLSAALVMTFVDEGKLKLTDTVGKFLPVLTQSGKGNITLAQCLSHTTGINAPSLREDLEGFRGMTSMDETIAKIAGLPMEGKPGTVFHYSNVGLQIAGTIIEKISGKSFETLFAERLTKPLDMADTDFGKRPVVLPAGGASSTPQDYLNFLTMILNKGTFNGKRILSESSIAQMQVNRVDKDVKIAYSPGAGTGFGYGFGEWVMDETKVGNFSKTVSSPGLFGSFPWVNNEKKYAAFLMTFYVKSDGRNERYKELKGLVDKAVL